MSAESIILALLLLATLPLWLPVLVMAMAGTAWLLCEVGIHLIGFLEFIQRRFFGRRS